MDAWIAVGLAAPPPIIMDLLDLLGELWASSVALFEGGRSLHS